MPERAVFWGELDLNGQIRPVPSHNLRLDQAKRLGYDPIVHPQDSLDSKSKDGIATLNELQAKFFSKKSNSSRD